MGAPPSIAVDHGTRVISPNDGIDTIDPNWEELALAAVRIHVAHNASTSKRIKQKQMNRFEKLGRAIPREIYGYIVPDDAKTFAEWSTDPAALDVILEGARRLRDSLNCSAVADWFNDQGVPVGPYCRRTTWNGAMVRRFYGNPLLKGFPQRGAMYSVKNFESGRRISKRNPRGPRYWPAPHLAYFEPSDFDELNFLPKCGPFTMLQEQLTELTNREGELLRNRHRLEGIQSRKLKLPATTGELKDTMLEEFSRLASDSYEMGNLMRKLVPVFQVYNVRLCDGGHLLPRAQVTLNLGGQFADVGLVPGLKEMLNATLTLDLFQPPQRERIREQVVYLAAQNLSHKQIAQRIEEKPTGTAVSNALALHKQLLTLGLATPYVTLFQPPDDYPKIRRHLNPRYHFEPADGYVRPPL